MPITVTREIQIDTGHRIPGHKGACRHVHGHRYRVGVTVEGPVCGEPGHSDEGMVMDFGDIKTLMIERIHNPLDHGFVAWRGDEPLVGFLQSQGYKLTLLEVIPTAENIAHWCFQQLAEPIGKLANGQLRLMSVTVWETPNNLAVYTPPR